MQQVNIHDPAGQSTLVRPVIGGSETILDADGRRNHCGAACAGVFQGHARNLGPAPANGKGCADRGANARLS